MAKESKQPLITVLMPCYNAMPFLPMAIESIMDQTYTNLEILCINDGSTDDTAQVLEKYAKEDPRIRVVHNEANLNLIRSLNKGIDLSNGEYIARMDADDISARDRMEIEFNFLVNNPQVDVVSSGMRVMTEKGKVVSKESPRQNTTMGCFFASFFYVPFHHAPMMARSNVFRQNLFINENYVLHAEDFELFSRILRNRLSVQNIDHLLYDVRLNSQSVSRKYTDVQDANFVECARIHYNTYTGVEYDKDIVRVLVNRFDSSLSLATLKAGIKEMKRFRPYFIEREKVQDPVALKEIGLIYSTQIFDICLQAIKKCSISIKCYAFGLLMFNFRIFFNKRLLNYLWDKIR